MFEQRVPGVRFTRVGEEISGQIVNVRRTQQTEYSTRIPLYWENKAKSTRPVNPLTGQPNDPMLQYEVTIDTGIADENNCTEKRIFVRGKRMTDAFKQAVQKSAPHEGLLIGGHLTAIWTGTVPSQGGGADAKTYAFRYNPPAVGEGRRPDDTPVLAGNGMWQAAPQEPQPTPAFALRTQPPATSTTTNRPVVTPYVGAGSSVNAQPVQPVFDDVPPF